MDENNIDPRNNVIGKIHPHDDMLFKIGGRPTPDSYIHYNKVGISAVSNIEEGLMAATMKFETIKYCLDFPCGYGRVLRVLQTRLNPKIITACDINEEGLSFCAAEFGVEPLVSNRDLQKIEFRKKYDLIWVGSFFTHINRPTFSILMGVIAGILQNCGVVVFTTHGEYSLELIDKNVYGVQFPEKGKIIQILGNEGHYYTPYTHSPEYGVSISSHDFVLSEVRKAFGRQAKLLMYKYRGWDNHQDVYAFQRL
jgi:SAM-dependent methyltransferase